MRINSINEGRKEIEGTQINGQSTVDIRTQWIMTPLFSHNTSHQHEDLQDCIWYTGPSQSHLD